MLFDVRPKQVEAKKFTGGKKSFREMRKWLSERQYTVSWIPEEDLSSGAKLDEALSVWSSRRSAGPMSIPVGLWVVFDDEQSEFHYILMNDQSFHNAYKVPEKRV